MNRKWFALALCAVLLLLCLPARAADTGYSGPLDPETGEPVGEENPEKDGRTALSGGMYYDWYIHDFAYPIGDTLGEVHSNAADGMVLTSPVSISATGDTPVTVHRDGVGYTGGLSRIDGVGSYTVSANVGTQTRRLLSFTLVGSSTNAIHSLVMPDGFYITEATRDGEYIYADRYTVSMETEGDYAIRYECSATDMVYQLETRIDRTPPALTFSGRVDKQGRVRSALSFTGFQPGDVIYLYEDPEAYPGDRLDGSARTAKEWYAESAQRLMKSFTTGGRCRSRGDPEAFPGKSP